MCSAQPIKSPYKKIKPQTKYSGETRKSNIICLPKKKKRKRNSMSVRIILLSFFFFLL